MDPKKDFNEFNSELMLFKPNKNGFNSPLKGNRFGLFTKRISIFINLYCSKSLAC